MFKKHFLTVLTPFTTTTYYYTHFKTKITQSIKFSHTTCKKHTHNLHTKNQGQQKATKNIRVVNFTTLQNFNTPKNYFPGISHKNAHYHWNQHILLYQKQFTKHKKTKSIFYTHSHLHLQRKTRNFGASLRESLISIIT